MGNRRPHDAGLELFVIANVDRVHGGSGDLGGRIDTGDRGVRARLEVTRARADHGVVDAEVGAASAQMASEGGRHLVA